MDRKITTLMTLTVALIFAGAALAQTGYEAQQPEPVDVSDQQLEQFADAQVEIAGIQQDFSGRLQNVDDPEKAHELQLKANEQMTQAVEEAGLDVESFNQIAMAIQNDPELQQKLTELLDQ